MKRLRFAILAPLLLLAACGHYSDGDRVGTVSKFSNKGFVSKTWEGELNLGGIRQVTTSDGKTSTTQNVANVWAFSVTDPVIVGKIQAAMDSAQPVRLHYSEALFVAPWTADTSYFVTAVDEIK